MARKFVRIFIFWHNLFREANSLSFEEHVQIMSQDKNPGIFSRQIAAIVLTIHQIFFTTRAVLKVKLGNIIQIFLSFSSGIFSHVTRLDLYFLYYASTFPAFFGKTSIFFLFFEKELLAFSVIFHDCDPDFSTNKDIGRQPGSVF